MIVVEPQNEAQPEIALSCDVRTTRRAIQFLTSALRAQICSYEAEAEGCGYSTVEADNEVWANLRRNPEGRGRFLHPSQQS